MRIETKSRLKNVLEENGVKTSGLLKVIQARYQDKAISQPTLYKVVNGENGMPDARTVEQIMHALREVTGKTFSLGDIFEWRPDAGEES